VLFPRKIEDFFPPKPFGYPGHVGKIDLRKMACANAICEKWVARGGKAEVNAANVVEARTQRAAV
jgi:hypothetical protein